MALRPEQEKAIHYLSQLNYGGLETLDKVAEECGVSRKTLYLWRNKNEEFKRELKKAIVANTLDKLPAVMNSMADAAIVDRNAQAAKLILQANDMLTDKVAVEERKSATSSEGLSDLKGKLNSLLGRKNSE